MKCEIIYEGNNGTLNLNKAPFIIKNLEELFNYDIGYNSTINQFENRENIDNFYFNGKTIDLNIQIVGKDKNSLIDSLDHLFNYDRSMNLQAKLRVNDYYAYCFVTKASNNYFAKFSNFEMITYTFKFTSYWIKEDVLSFRKEDDVLSNDKFHYPFSYPFSYKAVKQEQLINNVNYAKAKAKFIFYGPCFNPTVYINDNKYSVEANLLENERIEVDPYEKTVYKITNDGSLIDFMNYRYKKHSIFNEVPVGVSSFRKESSFDCRIILYYERGAPEWS